MAWSNASTRTKFTVEKSHSLSFSVRVEDRLHENIIQSSDKCLFTVRPIEYVVGVNDTDITVGTSTTPGNGIRVEAVREGTGEARRFLFRVDAAATNLDPELDYWYDITYVRDGYSLSVAAGEFEVMANVTNRAAQDNFIGDGSSLNLVAGINGNNVLNVTSSMPMPQKGDPGSGSYLIAQPLAQNVGSTVTYPLTTIIAPGNRTVQVGDVIFSSVTRGVLATVQSISTTGTPSVTIVTRQVFGQQTLKALLDTELHIVPPGGGVNLETVDHLWSCPKSQVPLPVGYEYRVGDFLFSHSAVSGYAVARKLLISLVEGQNATHLSVRTKVVFPVFLDERDIEELIDGMVPGTRRVNGMALNSDLNLTEDHIGPGSTYAKITHTEYNKLLQLPSISQLNTLLAGKANFSHTHTIANVGGLQASLDGKVGSTSTNTIWTGTQAQFDAISPKRSDTLYFIRS